MSIDLPQRVRQHVLGEEAVDVVRACFPKHWIKREESPDYGIDLVVEIVEGTAVTGVRFGVQIKGKGSSVEEGQKSVKISGVKKTSVAYWHRRPEPIMIAAYSASSSQVVWRWIDDISIPSTIETTISIPVSQNLATVNWTAFTSELDKRYEQLWTFRRQSLAGVSLQGKLSLEKSTRTKVPRKDYRECSLMVFKEGTIIQYGSKVGIIDCGRNSQDKMVNWLQVHQVTELEFIAISHLHSDHYSRFPRVLDVVKVQSVFLPPIADPNGRLSRLLTHTPAFTVVLGQLQFLKTKIYFFSDHYEIIHLQKGANPVVLEICFPIDALDRSSSQFKKTGLRMFNHNDICAVFRVSIGRTAFLVPGDASIDVWKELIKYNGERMRSHGILLPHNGSFHSISSKILKDVLYEGPFPAIYQPNSRFNLPKPETLELVRKLGGLLIKVDERHAAIEMTSSGIELQ